MYRLRGQQPFRAPGEFGFGGRPFGRGFGGGPGGGRRGRFFDQGDLRLVILKLTAEKPRYGYEIIKAIEERLAGLYSPSPGVVYPTLTLLEELGHVAIDQADGKKLYAATPEGLRHLEANRDTIEAILKRMADVNAANNGGPPPQLLRAIENVKLAMRLKMSSASLTEAQIAALAADFDALARRIDQI